MLLNAIPFSGGPWILTSWSKDQVVLRRNERYYAGEAALDEVTFVPRTDQDTEIASLVSGEVAAIAPQAGGEPQLLADALSAPSVAMRVAGGPQFDALWFSQTRAPTNDRLVREAMAYAIDREPILDALVRPLEPAAQPLGCGFVAVSGLGPWCATEPFATFTPDPARVRELLESAGYDCSSNPCKKQGEPLTVEYGTLSTSTLKTTVQDIVKRQLQAVGFVVQIKNYEASGLFGDFGCFARLSELTQCNEVAMPAASVTDLLSCDAIPSEANQFVGRNQIGWCDPEADHLLQESERELDPAVRAYLMHLVYQRERAAVIGLPLFAVPAVVAWRTDKVKGPVGQWAGSPYGPFFNMDRWEMADLDAEGVGEG
jgi:peptide/nickel transport system substrate-binding protein